MMMKRGRNRFCTAGNAVILTVCFILLFFGGIKADAAQEEAEQTPVRIACVGDSLTYGYNSSNPETQSYPAKLQSLLGEEYAVQNFGVNSATMLKKGNKPYWNQAAYSQSMASDPDIVILMLGTNDSKEVNWREHGGEFLSDMEEMIRGYQELPSSPQVYVGISPRLTADEVMELVNEVIVNEIGPLQRQAARELGCPVLDIYQLSETLGEEDFNDCVHPTDMGYQKIASYIFGELTGKKISMDLINDSEELSGGRGFLFEGRLWIKGNTAGSLNGKNGEEHYAVVTEENGPAHSYEVAFTGNRIQVYGHLSPNHGIAAYSVDGGEETQVSAFAQTRQGNALLYQASGLSDGPHILRVRATGRKDEKAQNAAIQVDYAIAFQEAEKASCTCGIESLVFLGGELQIPWDKNHCRRELTAECRVSPCQVEGHENRIPKLTYSVEQDPGGISRLEGEYLTVTGPGTVTVEVTAEIPGTGITEEGRAEFQVVKEREPEPETQPETQPETESRPEPEPGTGTETESERESEAEEESGFGSGAMQQPETPGIPGGLRVAGRKTKSLLLTWKPAKDTDFYRIYRRRKKTDTWELIRETDRTRYQDRGLKKGSTYQYKIQSCRLEGGLILQGESSRALTAAVRPAKPVLRGKWTRSGRIRLSWKRVTGASGFVIECRRPGKTFRKLEEKGAKARSCSINRKRWKKTGTYAFRIRAYKLEGKKRIYSLCSEVKKFWH